MKNKHHLIINKTNEKACSQIIFYHKMTKKLKNTKIFSKRLRKPAYKYQLKNKQIKKKTYLNKAYIKYLNQAW